MHCSNYLDYLLHQVYKNTYKILSFFSTVYFTICGKCDNPEQVYVVLTINLFNDRKLTEKGQNAIF